MSRLGINTGSNPNDGQGDPLRIAMGKINSNFTEIYNTFGDGINITGYANTAGISTLARNLTGSPRINVSGILNTGITTTEHIEVRNITSTGVVTATQFVGDGSQLTNVTALVGGLEVLDDNVRKGVARELNFGENITSTGPDGVGRVTISIASTIVVVGVVTNATYANVSGVSGVATYAQTSGISSYSVLSGVATYASTAGISTISQGLTGTPNIAVGIITASQFVGDGSLLTNVPGSQNSGYANTAGIATYATTSGISTYAATAGISTYATTSGISTYAATAGISTYATTSGISTYAATAGISTVAQGLIGTPNISVNRVGVTSYLTVTGVSTFYNNVHFDYDKYVLIGANDELQLFHNGSNSYIDNSSTNNLIVRTIGGAIVLSKYGPENMAVFNSDSSVDLYYNNSKKFETTNTGVNITGDLNLTGVLSVGGTSVVLNAAQLQVKDKDIVVGYTTDANNNDVSNDTTANHGGISIASTIGTPIINIPIQSGINSNPSTYKQFMWVKQGNYTGFNTDAWLTNYGISIGNTTTVQLGSRLTVGVGFTVYDTYLDATDIRVRNINATGIITGSSFRPSSGYYQSPNGTNAFYVYDTSGNVAFQGTIGASQINNSSGYKAIDFSSSSTPTVLIPNGLNVTGVTTSSAGFIGNLTGTATTAGYATTAGIATYATTSGISTISQGLTGTPNITVGVVTATSYNGSGVNLTGVITSLVAGTNVTITQTSGIATINATGGGVGESYWVTNSTGINTISNVGIGTTTATNTLTVSGNASISGVVTTTNLVVTGVATIATGVVTTLRGTNINYSGISTFSNVYVSGIATIATGIVTAIRGTNLNYTGVSTFAYGPVLISNTGTATTTGTAAQPLQVTGGGYISGSVGIGTTNPREKLDVLGGNISIQGIGTGNRFYIQHNTAQNSLDFVFI